MKEGDKIRVMVVSGGSLDFKLHKIYGAEIIKAFDDGDHRMWVTNDSGERLKAFMFKTHHLNGGSFKEVKLEAVK